MSKHVVLTGFESYGPYRVNPSELLVRSLEGRLVSGRLLTVRVLPVETRSLRERLEAVISQEQPEVLIGVGFGPGRAALALERVAVNLMDFEIPDAVGAMRKDDAVDKNGPEGRLATLPHHAIADAWAASGVPGYISTSAGTYIGNQWLYEALSITSIALPPIPTGFVHLPALPAQAVDLGAERTPSMTLELMRKGLETMIETIIPWLEARPEPPARTGSSVWIPRGLREVER